jgi:hypothetical protein
MSEMTWRADNIETIAGFFSGDECDGYIRLGESIGFEDATMIAPRGVKDVRNNDRVMIDEGLWRPILPYAADACDGN